MKKFLFSLLAGAVLALAFFDVTLDLSNTFITRFFNLFRYTTQPIKDPTKTHSAENSIRTSDRDLERALTILFSKEVGYTLVGAKPISDEECFWLRNFPPATKEKLFRFLRDVFEKNEDYILNIYTPFPKYTSITLIHKPTLIRTILKEPYLQEFTKKHFGTVKNLFHKLKGTHIFRCFRGDDVALGIVFGYGEGNARCVDREVALAYYLKKYPAICFFPFEPVPDPCSITHAFTRFCIPRVWNIPDPKEDPRFTSLEAEWRWLQEQSITLPQFDPPYLFLLPFFSAKKSEETRRILQRYAKARDILARLYCKKTFTKGVAEWVRNHNSNNSAHKTTSNDRENRF